jgi:hypothetical protein
LRVKIEGKRTPEEASQAVLKVLESLLKNYPDVSLRGFNFYFTFVNAEGEEIELCDNQGDPIEMLLVPDKNKPKKLPTKKQQTDNVLELPNQDVKIKSSKATRNK